jgi:hypothetical protein
MADLNRLIEDIEASIAGLTEPELHAARAGKWTIADILEHLSITYVRSVKGMLATVLANGPRAARPTFEQRVSALLVTRIGYFPPGRKAPDFTRPRGRVFADVLSDIRSALPEMERGIQECERRYGSEKIADHPILGPLSAAQWRSFHRVHTRHHLKQIATLRWRAGAD